MDDTHMGIGPREHLSTARRVTHEAFVPVLQPAAPNPDELAGRHVLVAGDNKHNANSLAAPNVVES